MTKDFSNPKKIGFLRFFEIWWGLGAFMMVFATAFLTKQDFEMNFSTFVSYVYTFSNAISLLFLVKRKSITRKVVTYTSLASILINASTLVAVMDDFDVAVFLLASLSLNFFDILTIIYFNISKRVKAQLTEPFSIDTIKSENEREAKLYNPRSWAFWRNLIIYFCIFSVVGHWLEAGYCTFIRFGIIPGTYDPNSQIWSDWLFPFPVYGIGAVACVLLLYPIKTLLQKNVHLKFAPFIGSFVVNALVCTLIELIMGLIWNTPAKPDGTLPLWDYSDMFCNFMGQICLQNAVAFGVAATFMVWFIYPSLEKFLSRFSKDAMNIAFVVIVLFFALLIALYLITMPSITSF